MVKQRDGPVGPVALIFRGEFTRFEPITQKLYSSNAEDRGVDLYVLERAMASSHPFRQPTSSST